MNALPSFRLHASSPLSSEIRRLGLRTYGEFALRVRDIPYGRPASPLPLAVFVENVGTCSSKHRLLAEVAHECGHSEIQLAVGIYEMCEANTPGVGEVLAAHGVASIPEAHCYLVAHGTRFDFTGLSAGRSSPFDVLLEEHIVLPEYLGMSKSRLHERALGAWALRVGMSRESAWQARESCIVALASGQAIGPRSPRQTGGPDAAAHVQPHTPEGRHA